MLPWIFIWISYIDKALLTFSYEFPATLSNLKKLLVHIIHSFQCVSSFLDWTCTFFSDNFMLLNFVLASHYFIRGICLRSAFSVCQKIDRLYFSLPVFAGWWRSSRNVMKLSISWTKIVYVKPSKIKVWQLN